MDILKELVLKIFLKTFYGKNLLKKKTTTKFFDNFLYFS